MVYSFGLWIIRHGETVSNKACIIQGQLDSPLNENGRRQADLAGKTFENTVFSHAFSSDLSRAEETCRIILASKAYKQDTLNISLDERLREKHYGVLEGQPSEVLHAIAKKARVSPHRFDAEGGETLADVYSRLKAVFEDICKEVVNFCVEKQTGQDLRRSSQFQSCKSGEAESLSLAEKSQATSQPAISIFDDKGVELKTSDASRVCHTHQQISFAKQSTGPINVNALDLNPVSTAGLRNYSSVSITSDDSSIPEQLDARVLVVSHGGSIRELFRYFMEDLDCVFPGGKATALRPLANTAISHFIITIDPQPASLDPAAATVSSTPVPPSPVVVDPFMEDVLAPRGSGGIRNGGIDNKIPMQINIICLYSHSKDHLLIELSPKENFNDPSNEDLKITSEKADSEPDGLVIEQMNGGPIFMASEQV